MSNDNRKSPFSDTTEGDEEDWDKALNAWELPAGAAPKGKDAAAPAAKPATQGPPLPPPRPPPPGESRDALLEMLFEEPDTTTRTQDPSVVTSAPDLKLEEIGSPAEHRRQPESDAVEEGPEGVLFDPFAPAPAEDERLPTLRPGAPGDEASTPSTPSISRAQSSRPLRPLAPPPPPRMPPRVDPGRDLTPIGELVPEEAAFAEQ